MNFGFLLAIAGASLFLLKKKGGAIGRHPPRSQEDPESGEESDDEIGPTWTFRVYPFTAGQSPQLVPPEDGNSVGVSGDCSVISVGEDWWDGPARVEAQTALSQGLSVEAATDAVFSKLLPTTCNFSNAATFEFRNDVEHFVRGL